MDNLKCVVFIDLINVRFELYHSKPLATIQWFLPNFPGFGMQVRKSTFLILAALTFSWPPTSLKVSPPWYCSFLKPTKSGLVLFASSVSRDSWEVFEPEHTTRQIAKASAKGNLAAVSPRTHRRVQPPASHPSEALSTTRSSRLLVTLGSHREPMWSRK